MASYDTVEKWRNVATELDREALDGRYFGEEARVFALASDLLGQAVRLAERHARKKDFFDSRLGIAHEEGDR